jgi:hypothetical protein
MVQLTGNSGENSIQWCRPYIRQNMSHEQQQAAICGKICHKCKHDENKIETHLKLT